MLPPLHTTLVKLLTFLFPCAASGATVSAAPQITRAAPSAESEAKPAAGAAAGGAPSQRSLPPALLKRLQARGVLPAGQQGEQQQQEEVPGARQQQQQQLPPGWEAGFDPTYNREYYYNASTGERSWERPGGAAPLAAPGHFPDRLCFCPRPPLLLLLILVPPPPPPSSPAPATPLPAPPSPLSPAPPVPPPLPVPSSPPSPSPPLSAAFEAISPATPPFGLAGWGAITPYLCSPPPSYLSTAEPSLCPDPEPPTIVVMQHASLAHT